MVVRAGPKGLDLGGRVAVVTGAASGMGRASAQLFAAAGAKVVVADIDSEGGEHTVHLIKQAGGEATFIACDITDEELVKAMVARTVELYGRIDAAHNNAAISGIGSTVECEREFWDHMMAVNLTGTWLCMKHEISAMLENGGGSIVNIGSAASLKASAGIVAYVTSKHGVAGLTKCAALEYGASNIRVNLVCPGFTLTPMLRQTEKEGYIKIDEAKSKVPLLRVGEPEEVARAVLWLCSDHATYVTGAILSVDGGLAQI